jgi:hypothetical protein
MDRRKTLETFAKQMREDIPLSEDLLEDVDNDIYNNGLLARNLSEDTLANELLKDTGISIPDDNAPISKKEDFLNRMLAERYPEFKDPNVRIGDESYYQKGNIFVREQPDILKQTSDLFHEGAHKFDVEDLGFQGRELSNQPLRRAKTSGMDLKSADPTQIYEIMAKGHHARIPNLRDADSFGQGALKSYMKNGVFKALPIIGPAIGAGMAAMSGDANAASGLPILGEAESLGPQKGSVDDMIENPKPGMTSEQRKKALEMLLKQQENTNEI